MLNFIFFPAATPLPLARLRALWGKGARRAGKGLSLFFTLLCCSTLSANPGWNDSLYHAIESRIIAPSFPDQSVTPAIRPSYSARRNQALIQRAIDHCSANGGGRVIIPEGTYLTGAITLRDNINLHISKGAILRFAFEPKLYPLVFTRWEGLNLMNYQPCIYSNGATNVAITGEGEIDGNGNNDRWWPWNGNPKYGYFEGSETQRDIKDKKTGELIPGSRQRLITMAENNTPIAERIFGPGQGLRPQLINLVNTQNILIEGVTLTNSPFWVIHPLFCRNVTVRNVTIINEGPNGDGCDPESSEDILIENCIFHTGDDCIAIKSGRNADGRRDARPTRNVIIRGCTMEDGHGGVVIGSEISAGVENVFAEDCDMDSPNLDRVLRLKTNTCRGGETQNIFMRNVRVGQCRESVLRININYEPREKAERGHIPYVHNVWMENVTCQKSRYGVQINGIEEADAVYDIHVHNCSFNGVTDEPFRREGRFHDIDFTNLTVNGTLLRP